jgi:hypothetical protein
MPGIEAVQAHPKRVLLISWPSYNEPWATGVLRAYRGNLFFYIGEHSGGCCADDSFFHLLGAEWEEVECVDIPCWSGIHDYLFIYRRK